jgi:hypothetical protein
MRVGFRRAAPKWHTGLRTGGPVRVDHARDHANARDRARSQAAWLLVEEVLGNKCEVTINRLRSALRDAGS